MRNAHEVKMQDMFLRCFHSNGFEQTVHTADPLNLCVCVCVCKPGPNTSAQTQTETCAKQIQRAKARTRSNVFHTYFSHTENSIILPV